MRSETREKLVVIGSGSRFGLELFEYCARFYDVIGFSRKDFDLLDLDSINRLGESIVDISPSVVVLNSYIRTLTSNEEAYAQLRALRVLWAILRDMPLSMIVVGSAIAWNKDSGGQEVRLYQRSKKDMADFCVSSGWLNTELPHKAKMILFEPATMTNQPHLAKPRKTTLLSVESSWALIRGALDSKLPFVRVGGQGSTYVR